MYTIEDFLNNNNKIAIIKDGTKGWGNIAAELCDMGIKQLAFFDLDENPKTSVVYGHMGTDYIQSASLKDVKSAGYTNISPDQIDLKSCNTNNNNNGQRASNERKNTTMMNIKLITNSDRDLLPVSENTTVRSFLEENGVDYHAASINLDGYTLRGAELDKTFAQLGAVDNTILSAIIKTDNAATATVAGAACVITSAAKLEDLKLIKKYRPKALTMYEGDDKKEVSFRVMMENTPKGDVGATAISFSNVASAGGCATVTIDVTDKDMEAVEDKIGAALLKLTKMEETFAAILDEIHAEQAQVREHITIA